MITGEDIRNRTVEAEDLARGSVTTNKVKNRTLKLKDLSAEVTDKLAAGGATGPQGPKGETGPVGPAGPPGSAADVSALEAKFIKLLSIQQNCELDFITPTPMWEVTWGYDFANRNGGEAKFTMQSNGGLVALNGGPVPSYMGPSWEWLYVSAPVVDKVWTYTFQDGTIRTATVTSNAKGCPVIAWDLGES